MAYLAAYRCSDHEREWPNWVRKAVVYQNAYQRQLRADNSKDDLVISGGLRTLMAVPTKGCNSDVSAIQSC